MLGGLGPTELIIIFLIVLVLFGARRIPDIAKGLGKGIKDFKSALQEDSDDNSRSESKTESQQSETTKNA
ncbi:MAG: twin-arginine translocase TatA/TatE family subunit [Candidatus Poribacteria bacterium]|nr:twin-arginine translocase TatA/TatE family subunit [Candidatus Poribacteria bacterium]